MDGAARRTVGIVEVVTGGSILIGIKRSSVAVATALLPILKQGALRIIPSLVVVAAVGDQDASRTLSPHLRLVVYQMDHFNPGQVASCRL